MHALVPQDPAERAPPRIWTCLPVLRDHLCQGARISVPARYLLSPGAVLSFVPPRSQSGRTPVNLTHLPRIARGQTNRLLSGVTSPLQGAEVQNPLFSPLKRGCDPGSQTMCLPPGYPGKTMPPRSHGNICPCTGVLQSLGLISRRFVRLLGTAAGVLRAAAAEANPTPILVQSESSITIWFIRP